MSTRESLHRWLPITNWLPRYQRRWLLPDTIAGLTIWGLLIPEMIAYASLAGLSPQAGLYTLLASLGLYAIFGTSRQLVCAGTSASAVLVFSAVTGLSPKNPDDYATLAAALIIITGIAFVVAGFCKLGFITEFLSRPVMTGFVFGLAIFVSVSQLPKLFGLEKGDGDTLEQLWHIIAHLDQASLTTMAVGFGTLAVLFGIERWLPRVPGGIVALVGGISISAMFNLSSHGVAIIGDIPSGLPSVDVPSISLDQLWVLIPSALGMVLVIYSEALGAATTFADKHGYRLDNNQEMIAIGLANLGSGFLGGLANGGSLSQTAVNDGAGARSEVSPIVAAVMSLITVLALTSLFHDLPEAVLGALIIHAVSHLMRVGEMRRYYRLIPREFWLAMATLLGVITLDVLPGLLIGVILSIILLVGRASRPRLSNLGHDTDEHAYRDQTRDPNAHPTAGVVVIRPDAPLFYANAQSVADGIRDAVTPSTRAVVLDLDANDQIDITSAEQLAKLAEGLRARHVRLILVHVHQPVRVLAERMGLMDQLHVDDLQPTLDAALAEATRSSGGPRTP